MLVKATVAYFALEKSRLIHDGSCTLSDQYYENIGQTCNDTAGVQSISRLLAKLGLRNSSGGRIMMQPITMLRAVVCW
jgi:hypothetical protein